MFTHHFAATPDGGRLSYYSIGQGPSILVIHGSVSYALTHSELAQALSSSFTVHVASRRGRGLSDQYPDSVGSTTPQFDDASGGSDREPGATYQVGSKTYRRTYNPLFSTRVLDCEVSDLAVLLAATKAEFVIGVSSGALVVLETLLRPSMRPAFSSVRRVVLFEPPLYCTDHESACILGSVGRFEEETSRGDTLDAMVTAMSIVQLGPGWIPRWLMKGLSFLMFRAQEKDVEKRRADGEEDRGTCTMKGLGRLLRYDFAIAEGMIGSSERYAPLRHSEQEMMLLYGSKSPEYLKQSIAVLQGVIPNCKSVVVEDSGHELLCNEEMRGKPAKAVPVICKFFVSSNPA